jgi:hypothetical protein
VVLAPGQAQVPGRELDENTRAHLARSFALANRLSMMWKYVRLLLLRDRAQGRRLDPMWLPVGR